MSITDESTTGKVVTTISNTGLIPCVQYGFPKDQDRAIREPILRTIFDKPPEGAETASPLYFLTPEQHGQQHALQNPYRVSGFTSIATELQTRCETAERVLYPIYIESDVYEEKGPETLIGWFKRFVEDYLDLAFETCTLYYSGSRSIHVHVPRFVTTESQRERLKRLAETFCEETGAELDVGIYSRKRLFRLPGVAHDKSGSRKVEIRPDWDHTRICREANLSADTVPDSFESVLRRVFTPERTAPYTSVDVHTVLNDEDFVLSLPEEDSKIPVPLIEQEISPTELKARSRWNQYNAKEFSPYALAAGNGRSIAVVLAKGGAFARRNTRKGATMIPAYFYGARGCAGKEFMKSNVCAPLQLSGRDYEKWVVRGIEPGDRVVVIGGQSRNSRIFRVEPADAIITGHILRDEEHSRQDALNYLESQGYDIGSSGLGKRSPVSKRSPVTVRAEKGTTRPQTEASRLQERAEREGVETLTHFERVRVACRLLLGGWDNAWRWFREQFGPNFSPKITWVQFNSIVTSYPEYAFEVPPRPR
jgi:hypothetical protein